MIINNPIPVTNNILYPKNIRQMATAKTTNNPILYCSESLIRLKTIEGKIETNKKDVAIKLPIWSVFFPKKSNTKMSIFTANTDNKHKIKKIL